MGADAIDVITLSPVCERKLGNTITGLSERSEATFHATPGGECAVLGIERLLKTDVAEGRRLLLVQLMALASRRLDAGRQ